MTTPVTNPYRITMKEGDLKAIRLIVPDTLDMSERHAKIQVRDRPRGKVVLEFSTLDTENNYLQKNGQYINWTIPAFLSVGKAGVYEWECAIYSNTADARRRARGPFEITPSITQL
jgi:hypothetical protein